MNRPVLATLAVVLALCSALAGCGRPPDAPGELVWAAGRIDAVGPDTVIAGMWNARHPQGPHVRVVALPESADDQRQQLSLELGAGLDDIDVVQTDVAWTAEFARSGWLSDLEDMRPDLADRVLPGTLATAEWNGTLWGAPFTTNVGVLFYRKDLVPHPPRSWQELLDVGHRVGDPRGMAPLVADGSRDEGLVVQYLEYLWAAGGDLRLGDDTGGGDRRGIDDRAALDAARFMRSGYRGGAYAPGYSTMALGDAIAAFREGKAVFLRSWPYAAGDLTRVDNPTADRVGMVALPRSLAPASTGAPEPAAVPSALGGSDLAITKASTRQDAARELIRFATTSPDVARTQATAYSEAPALGSTYAEMPGNTVLSMVGREVPRGRSRPASPDWALVSPEIAQQVQACYLGTTSPEDAVAAIHHSIDATGSS